MFRSPITLSLGMLALMFIAPADAQMEPFRAKAALAPSAPVLNVEPEKDLGGDPSPLDVPRRPAKEPGIPGEAGARFRFSVTDHISVYLSRHGAPEDPRGLTPHAKETNTMEFWRVLPNLLQGSSRDALSTAGKIFEPEVGLGIAF